MCVAVRSPRCHHGKFLTKLLSGDWSQEGFLNVEYQDSSSGTPGVSGAATFCCCCSAQVLLPCFWLPLLLLPTDEQGETSPSPLPLLYSSTSSLQPRTWEPWRIFPLHPDLSWPLTSPKAEYLSSPLVDSPSLPRLREKSTRRW